VTIRAALLQEIGLASDGASAAATPFRRLSDQRPAPATKAVIAPLLVSSLACRDHAAMQQADGLLDAIRAHFRTAQVLQTGDVFAITLRETVSSTGTTRDFAPFGTVAIPASAWAVTGDEGNAGGCDSIAIVPPLDVDTALVFFRVESVESELSGSTAMLALSVSSETELLQIGSISAAAPDEAVIKEFLAAQTSSDGDSASSTSLQSPSLDHLYEMLHPSQLCDVPVSVLLAGPSGVGKSTLVHDAARQLGVSVVEVPFAELLTAGQSELYLIQNMREQVAKAQALAPCVLYMSHFFAIDKHDEEAELRLASALSECLRSLNARSSSTTTPNIPLVACVDDITEVPKFVRQCFLYELTLEAPDQKARLAYLEQTAKTVRLHADIELATVAQMTAGRTCGELSALMTDAGMRTIERSRGEDPTQSVMDQLVVCADESSPSSIAWKDLEAALKYQQSQASAAKMGGAASIPNVKWEDVGGLDDVKDEILDVVQLPLKHPELFASGVRQRSGILLYGPPGTGKTLLAKAIATECNMNFLSVKGPELLNMYIGESEKNVRQVFAKARSCRPCVLFFDELDSLAPMRGRGSDSGGVMDRVVSQLLTEIDGLSGGGSSGQDQVFVIGATNRPDLIETGLLRPGRFDRLLYLGICTERPAQRKVVEALTRKFTLADDVDLDDIVAGCPLNFTGADFYALCSGALAAALKERVEELDRQLEELNAEDCYSSTPVTARVLLNRLSPDELNVRVGQQHFLSSLSQVVPSVSPAEIRHYEKLRDQYSSRQTN
jgi:peroxin-6